MLEWLSANYVIIITFLFLFSEALAVIPFFKSNSVFQMIANVLKFIKEKIVPAK